MPNWFTELFAGSPQPAPVPVITNQVFQPYEQDFWRLYERCRYNGIICTARVVDAVRTDNRANIWLLISVVGAGLAGGVKAITHVETDVVWEIATLISVVLAIVALWRKAPEIKYTVFESIGTFDSLAVDVQHKTIGFRTRGTEQEITVAYKSIYDPFSAELKKLGPDHTNYATAKRKQLDRTLKRTLRAEGIARG